MFPGLNPRDMKKAMQKLGVKEEEIDSYEVVIKTPEKNLVIKDPHVTKINMMGQQSIQVVGEIQEEEIISEDDVNAVAERASVSKEKARNALKEAGGDLAAAILKLQEK